MARKHRHEEHLNHEAWAIPYADLITLLLAFFVVMYAISSVNAGKYRVLSDALHAAFNGTPRTPDPIPIGELQTGSDTNAKPAPVQSPLIMNQPRSLLSPIPMKSELSQKGQAAADIGPSAAELLRAEQAKAALERVAQNVEAAMHDLVLKDQVVVRRGETSVEVEIRTDILFPSGSATLAPGAIDVLGRLAQSLKAAPNPIRVEGHTDNRPISTIAFPSNWELSAARAGSVVHLFSSRGIDPARLAVIGLGEYRPVKANNTVEGRNANRRVVVVILSPDSARDGAPIRGMVPAT